MRTRKADTGHPDGLYRVLQHQDGHVVLFASKAADVPRLEATAAALTETGQDGYTLGWLPLDEAVDQFTDSINCGTCATESPVA